MKENEFFPFGGGQVGGWVNYGQNFEILNSLLSNRKAPAISVAPKPARKRAARQSPSAFPQTEIGDFHAALMNAPNSSAALRINKDTEEVIRNLMASARAWPSHGVAYALAGARKESKSLTALSGDGANVSTILAARRQAGSGPNAIGNFAPFHLPSIFAPGHQNALPSFAPIKKASIGHGESAYATGSSANRLPAPAGKPGSPAVAAAGRPQIDQWQFSEMLSDELDRQARLPPSGASGFNPRLSPAWPGVKLPN